LNAFLAAAESPLLVVINDATRPTPSADVLAVIRDRLEAWLGGAPGRELSFAVATGTHRALLPGEIERVLGPDVAQAHRGRIFVHDALDERNLMYLGRTSRGVEVEANRLLVEARSIIAINSVEPHYFAGYTGGRKSLFPGLAGYRTVRGNHALSMESGSEALRLEGNPVHEDLQEALALGIAGKRVYSIQLVLDKVHSIGFAAAGSMEESFAAAVAVAERQFVVDIDRPYEVVVSVVPYPMDCDFYQSNKAIQSGARAVADGGVLIIVSECPFGLGENQTLYDTLTAAASPEDALERLAGQEYRLGLHQPARVARILQRAEIWVVSSLSDEVVSAMFMRPFAGVQSAVDAALRSQGAGARVLVLTEASITVPRVAAPQV
jgi:nickel-dependent lactate racemase